MRPLVPPFLALTLALVACQPAPVTGPVKPRATASAKVETALTETLGPKTPLTTLPVAPILSDMGAGIISSNGGGVIGKVKIPNGIVANNTGSLIANNGGGISLRSGSAIISSNGGAIISSNGGGYHLFALPEAPLEGFTVTIVDARGGAIAGPDGKPYTAVTDANGNYKFTVSPRGTNLLLQVTLPAAVGAMLAYLPDATAGTARDADIDGASTLAMAYILEKFVRTAADPQGALAKLPALAAADTRAKLAQALGDALALKSFAATEVLPGVDALRAKDPALDAQVKYVESLLVAGQKDLSDGRMATEVGLASPKVAIRMADGSLLIAERNGYRVRRVTADGKVSTFAGRDGVTDLGDGGPATEAYVDRPTGLAVDKAGNVYVSDFGADRLRRVDAKTGIITTVAGIGNAPETRSLLAEPTDALTTVLVRPNGVLLDAQERPIVLSSEGVHRLEGSKLRKLDYPGKVQAEAELCNAPDGTVYAYDYHDGQFFKLVGDTFTPLPDVPAKPGASFSKIAVGADGTFYLCDDVTLWKLVGKTWTQVVFTEDHGQLQGLVVDGDALIVCDIQINRVWRIPLDGSKATLLAGLAAVTRPDGVKAEDLNLNRPTAVAIDGANNLYVADGFSAVIWRRRPDGLYDRFAGSTEAVGSVSDIGDGGQARDARFGKIVGMVITPDGRMLIIDAPIPTFRLREISPLGIVRTVKLPEALVAPATLSLGPNDAVYISDYLGTGMYVLQNGEAKVQFGPEVSQKAGQVAFPRTPPLGLPNGTYYLSDLEDHAIKAVVDGKPQALIGGGGKGFGGDGGPAADAKLDSPLAMALDAQDRLYFSDSRNDRVRRYDPRTGIVTTVVGAGGVALTGTGVEDGIKEPFGLAFDRAGNLFIADSVHNQIKQVPAARLE